jgi:ssDNA-binding Zn-finger/Zn-ribbon topoisomerase 1
VYTELQEFGGKKVRVEVPAPMTQEQIEKALKTCPDLAKEVVKQISAETIEALVKCSGDPEEVDRIWPPEEKKAAPAKTETKTEATGTEGFSDEGLVGDDLTPAVNEEPKVEAKVSVKEEPKAAPAVEEDDEEALLMKQLAEAKARKAAAKAAAEKKTETATAGLGKSVDNADDFLAQFDAQ